MHKQIIGKKNQHQILNAHLLMLERLFNLLYFLKNLQIYP